MTTDMQGTEWRFDAVDLRPVLRWLERPEARLNAEAVEVVEIGSGVTQVDRLVSLGAARIRSGPDGTVVLTDPDDNEFDVRAG